GALARARTREAAGVSRMARRRRRRAGAEARGGSAVMSYPIADVDRFAEYETNPLPVRVRGEELTVGAISRGMKSYAQAFDLLRGELLNKRSGFANEYDLWCWLGAQLLELERDPAKSRVVLAYWRSLYP